MKDHLRRIAIARQLEQEHGGRVKFQVKEPRESRLKESS